MLWYIITNEDFDVTLYYPYDTYNDILRYYNVGDLLHSNEVIKTHFTLAIL
jgi:hypothetical protein